MNPFLRLRYQFERRALGLRLWTRRRFTPAGLTVLAAALLAGALGTDPENSASYQVFPLLTALLLVGAAFAPFFRAKFAVRRHLPRLATAGQPFTYRVSVRNLTGKPQRGLVLLDEPANLCPTFEEWRARRRDERRRRRHFRLSRPRSLTPFPPVRVSEVALPPVPAGREETVAVEAIAWRRGLVHWKQVILGRPDPLGLFRALIRLPAPQTLVVLPRRYPLPPLALPGRLQYQPGGVTLASRVGQSEEFVALRDYRRGDPLRHIHWRSYARAGRPIVKEFEDEYFARHALVLDTFTDQFESEAFEEAVSVAASFACTVLTQESLLDLLFVGPQAYCFTAGRGLAQADQMLEILAGVRPCRDRPFAALERLVLGHVPLLSGCICVLLAWDAARRSLVDRLRSLGVPVWVLVIAPAGSPLAALARSPRDGAAPLHVLETGRIAEGLAKLAW